MEKQFQELFDVRHSHNLPSHHDLEQEHLNQINHNNRPFVINTTTTNPSTIIHSQISLSVTVMGPWESEMKNDASPSGPELTTTYPTAASNTNEPHTSTQGTYYMSLSPISPLSPIYPLSHVTVF